MAKGPRFSLPPDGKIAGPDAAPFDACILFASVLSWPLNEGCCFRGFADHLRGCPAVDPPAFWVVRDKRRPSTAELVADSAGPRAATTSSVRPSDGRGRRSTPGLAVARGVPGRSGGGMDIVLPDTDGRDAALRAAAAPESALQQPRVLPAGGVHRGHAVPEPVPPASCPPRRGVDAVRTKPIRHYALVRRRGDGRARRPGSADRWRASWWSTTSANRGAESRRYPRGRRGPRGLLRSPRAAKEALEQAARIAPDHVLLDVVIAGNRRLPEDRAKRLKQQAGRHFLPIILLTSSSPSPNSRFGGFRPGADESPDQAPLDRGRAWRCASGQPAPRAREGSLASRAANRRLVRACSRSAEGDGSVR